MEKKTNPQLELFSQAKNYNKPADAGSSFFTCLWRHEKIIITVMGGLFIAIVSFSLGVEKGRRLAMSGGSNQVLAKVAQKQAEPVQMQVAAQKEKQEAPQAQPKLIKELEENYTIQLASYQSKGAAQKEAEALKKKGMAPQVFTKGKYTVLCVGKFSGQDKAKIMLSELKKRYKDCLIRRL